MAADWYAEVCRRTGRLVALWQCVGWCHGVLNTDNMSVLGLTIDYGPVRARVRACGFVLAGVHVCVSVGALMSVACLFGA